MMITEKTLDDLRAGLMQIRAGKDEASAKLTELSNAEQRQIGAIQLAESVLADEQAAADTINGE